MDDTALTKVQQALALGTGRPEDRPAPPATPEQDRPPQVRGLSEEELRAQGIHVGRDGLFDGLG
ncbi:MAG: hypothetical protein ACR2ML_12105 [Solirubrobacteraceae bacterium]